MPGAHGGAEPRASTEAVLAGAARQIVLFHLDRAWAEHLAFLADLREGIHLRALARGTVPLNEFNKEAIRAFARLLEEAAARSARDLPDRPDHRRRRSTSRPSA